LPGRYRTTGRPTSHRPPIVTHRLTQDPARILVTGAQVQDLRLSDSQEMVEERSRAEGESLSDATAERAEPLRRAPAAGKASAAPLPDQAAVTGWWSGSIETGDWVEATKTIPITPADHLSLGTPLPTPRIRRTDPHDQTVPAADLEHPPQTRRVERAIRSHQHPHPSPDQPRLRLPLTRSPSSPWPCSPAADYNSNSPAENRGGPRKRQETPPATPANSGSPGTSRQANQSPYNTDPGSTERALKGIHSSVFASTMTPFADFADDTPVESPEPIGTSSHSPAPIFRYGGSDGGTCLPIATSRQSCPRRDNAASSPPDFPP